MATEIIDTTYRFCGTWQDTHGAHLVFGGYLCPGTKGSAAGTVTELVTALEALLPHAVTYVHSMRGKLAIAAARDLLLRLKSTPTA